LVYDIKKFEKNKSSTTFIPIIPIKVVLDKACGQIKNPTTELLQ